MNKFEKILLSLFFIELFVGGGGRLISFHGLSIRQFLFILLLVTYAFRIVKEKALFNKDINTLIRLNPVTLGAYFLIVWFAVSGLIGIIHHHNKSLVITSFLRVFYFALYFPLAYYISNDRFPLKRTIGILKYCALAVSLFTIIVSLLGKTIFSGNSFPVFYNFMNYITSNDLFFRPSNSVFYKSQFYVLIGLMISLNDWLNKSYKKLDIAIVILGAVSLIWSETRGFLLAFMLSVLMVIILDAIAMSKPVKGLANKTRLLVQSKQFIIKFIILIIVMVTVPFLYQNMTLNRFSTTSTPVTHTHGKPPEVSQPVNDVSVNARVKFIFASEKILKHPSNLLIGSGYATNIGGRTTGIEMSFLQILVEQGIIGFASWVFLFLIVYFNYYVAFKNGYKPTTLDISLLAVFMGVLLLTNINPFINNPIGIGFFIILLIVSQRKKELKSNEEYV